MRTMRFRDEGEDVRLLHAVLNFHLPPPSDQLPTSGDGALNYGPRTVEKVKEFQKLNRIDIGQPDHMDGIVGPHTRAVLESGAEVVFRVGFDPTEAPKPLPPFLTPVPFPPLPTPVPFPPLPKLGAPVLMPPIPQPPFIPVPKLHLDNVQIAAGLSHTINFTRKPTDSTFMQVQYTMLWKSDGPHDGDQRWRRAPVFRQRPGRGKRHPVVWTGHACANSGVRQAQRLLLCSNRHSESPNDEPVQACVWHRSWCAVSVGHH